MKSLLIIGFAMLSFQAQAKTCGTELIDEKMGGLVQIALEQTFDNMDTPYTNPTQLELYEILKVCETPQQGLKLREAEVHVDVIFSEIFSDESNEPSIEMTSCQVYLEYEEADSLWITSEVICDNDFGWVP